MLEMFVACIQRKPVLNAHGSDPDVVNWNRRSLAEKLHGQCCKRINGLIVRV
jgi:hypothetical protein